MSYTKDDIVSVRFTDALERNAIVATADGREHGVPADPARGYWQAVMGWASEPGNAIGPFVAPAPETTEQIYDAAIASQRLLRAVVLALNDGTLVPGANATPAVLKSIIVAKL